MTPLPAARRYELACALFPRLLALVYLSAFVSTGLQLPGLAGPAGILPVEEALEAARASLGMAAYWQLPTLAWLSASDAALTGTALAGCVFAGLMLVGRLPRVAALAAYALYLSLFHAGQIFMNFQWDYLLLESGFLAVFLPGRSPLVPWLFRWLLFRLRFLSGLAKLLSQDPSWVGLTAVGYFLETQPLPHWGAWYAYLLPQPLLQAATAAVLVIELVIPFTGFMPRGFRLVGAWATLAMQFAILASANHNYANLLTIALCVFLFDDQALGRLLPTGLRRWLGHPEVAAPPAADPGGSKRAEGPRPPGDASGLTRRGVGSIERRVVVPLVAGLVLVVSVLQMGETLLGRAAIGPAATLLDALRPLRLVSKYHAFPTMKTERIELEVEGSRDGKTWRPYAFRYKPGDPARRPEFVVPHQPRLDWMMWLVPLDPYFLPWLERFLEGLLAGSPAVLSLLAADPFPEGPPQVVRVSLYRYRFTDPDTRAVTGAWWTREYLGPFQPLPFLQRG